MVSPAVINSVLSQAITLATHSWEFGTVAEALLEWNNASLSMWNQPFPNSGVPTLDVARVQSLSYVEPHIRTNATTLVDGDGAAGDPASLGISALLIGKTNSIYYDAALRQYNHLVNEVPRWSNGAISHREDHPELWADFVYMVPPFMAYYAVAQNTLAAAKDAANQCLLYEQVLRSQQGPWEHIISNAEGSGHTTDTGLWSTGNAWAAAGSARVLATLRKSSFNVDTRAEQQGLTNLIKNIINKAKSLDTDSSGLLRNYLNDSSWFGEISGTSLIVATTFRMAVLEPNTFGKEYTDWAEKKMMVVNGKINTSTGIVAPAVNPLNWNDRTPFTSGSPEGQSFVVLLHAAERDFKTGRKA